MNWLFGLFTRNRCYRGGLKHNFRPRITVQEDFPDLSKLNDYQSYVLVTSCGTTRTQVYHGDVCTWCGKTTQP